MEQANLMGKPLKPRKPGDKQGNAQVFQAEPHQPLGHSQAAQENKAGMFEDARKNPSNQGNGQLRPLFHSAERASYENARTAKEKVAG